MDNRIKFENIIKLLGSNSKDSLCKECLNDIDKRGIRVKSYNKPFNKIRQLEVLRKRYKSQNVANEEKVIFGFLDLIDNLDTFNGELVCLTNIANEKKMYTLFTDVDFKNFIGIIVNRGTNIKRHLALEEEYLEKGYSQIDRWFIPLQPDLPL